MISARAGEPRSSLNPSGPVMTAGLCFGTGRRKQDRSRTASRGVAEERCRDVGCHGEQATWAAGEQIGASKAGMRRNADQLPARRVAAPLQFQREHQAGELGLPICLPWRVVALALQIAEIDRPGAMRQAADTDDPRRTGQAQQRQQSRRERKMAEMVGAELHLETISRNLPARQGHHAGIVDQEIKRWPRLNALGKGGDRSEVG